MKKILLLGSGELGKEFVIACQRLGQYVIAVDSYDHAPAMQVAHEKEIINMLDGNALDALVEKHQPDLIIPEIEAIRTERFYDYEHQGYNVVPSAKAANYTMNRKSIRDLAAKDLNVRTAPYCYAKSLEELKKGVEFCGFPCVVKPLMSSSGDYQESWQPMEMESDRLKEAQEMAKIVTNALVGAGIWGVEFFITKNATYFSELSPRPHDTGMVTLAGTQNFNEFELHARAVLGFPIPEIKLLKNGASAVVLANDSSTSQPVFSGLEKAMSSKETDIRIFGKPSTRPNRRMAVILKYGSEGVEKLVSKAVALAKEVKVN